MTYKSVFQLAIQLCALYFIFRSILELLRMFAFLFLDASGDFPGVFGAVFFQVMVTAVLIATGLVLLFNAGKITHFFSPKDSNEVLSVQKRDIIEVTILVMGILLLVNAVADVLPVIAEYGSYGASAALISTIATFVLGAILVVRARAISSVIMKLNAISGNSEDTNY